VRLAEISKSAPLANAQRALAFILVAKLLRKKFRRSLLKFINRLSKAGKCRRSDCKQTA
jgi:hypothetical protein